jgi:concentrative nucleoside transporter, CNT family
MFDPRTRLIMSYALCGFANFGSAGIMIGGIGIMIPERRAEVAQLGMRSIISGTLATCMSGAVVGWIGA